MENTQKSTPPQFRLNSPDICVGCGKTKEELAEEYGGYLVIRLPVAGIALFTCPHCNIVMTNSNAYELTKELQRREQEREQKKIIPARSPLIVPTPEFNRN